MDRFSPFRFRSPLLTESLLFSLPAGTEMFHFPAFPPGSLCVQLPVMRHDAARGFPIRKSWPQRPVIDSTRLIADSHVLHRLPMPRHPPCALVNLTTNRSSKSTSTNRENHKEPHPRAWIQGLPSKKLLCTAPHTRPDQTADTRLRHPYKMLASTMQFPNNNPVAPTTRAPGPKSWNCAAAAMRGTTETTSTRNTAHLRARAPRVLLPQDPTVRQGPGTPPPPVLSSPQAGVLEPEATSLPGHDSLTFHP